MFAARRGSARRVARDRRRTAQTGQHHPNDVLPENELLWLKCGNSKLQSVMSAPSDAPSSAPSAASQSMSCRLGTRRVFEPKTRGVSPPAPGPNPAPPPLPAESSPALSVSSTQSGWNRLPYESSHCLSRCLGPEGSGKTQGDGSVLAAAGSGGRRQTVRGAGALTCRTSRGLGRRTTGAAGPAGPVVSSCVGAPRTPARCLCTSGALVSRAGALHGRNARKGSDLIWEALLGVLVGCRSTTRAPTHRPAPRRDRFRRR